MRNMRHFIKEIKQEGYILATSINEIDKFGVVLGTYLVLWTSIAFTVFLWSLG